MVCWELGCRANELTVSHIFMLQQFSIVISHCSVVGRHVKGVGTTFLCTTYVFLMRGRNGL